MRVTLHSEAKDRIKPRAPGRRFYFKSQISTLKLQFSNLKFEISNLKFESSDLKSNISNLKFDISNLRFEILPLCLCVVAALLLSACGYHVSGTASQMLPGLKVIAVPAIKNDTQRYRIEQRMTEAVVHEFIARTKYRIVSSEDSADAVLHGEITSFEAIPVVFDTTAFVDTSIRIVPAITVPTPRATTTPTSVHMKVLLEESVR